MRLFSGKPKSSTTQVEPSSVDSFPYRTRDDFLSPAEQSFYLVLNAMMGEKFTICPKVSLADIFFVTRPNENKGAYNRINRKHVDFLICEQKTIKPRFAIELDDSSHQREDREERDGFVDAVFNAAELPLIHIPVRNAYNTAELGVLFKEALRQQGDSSKNQKTLDQMSTAPGVSQKLSTSQTPICPKCGVPMVLRTASKGDQAGKQFYGCPNFPKCREVLPFIMERSN